MKLTTVKTILNEYSDNKLLLRYRVWCDQNDFYVKDQIALFAFGKDKSVLYNDLRELAEDLNIDISELDWRKYAAIN